MIEPKVCTRCGSDKIEKIPMKAEQVTIFVCANCEAFCSYKDEELKQSKFEFIFK
jgi:hypothetical protein